MSKTNVSIGFWLPTQATLLVLFYGGIMPNLPWWVVWLPTLIILGFLAIAVVIVILVAAIAMLFG